MNGADPERAGRERSSRIPGQRVQAEFQYDDLGPEKFHQRNRDAVERRHKSLVIGFGRQRNIDVISPARSFADFIFKTAPGEKCPAGLMQRDGHHILALIKSRLHSVAVMRVHVQI